LEKTAVLFRKVYSFEENSSTI